MTAFTLQEDLAEELRKLFFEFCISEKQDFKKTNVFLQDIPFSQNKKEVKQIAFVFPLEKR